MLMFREDVSQLSLADLDPETVHIAAHTAVVRLQLFMIGEVHEGLLKVADAGKTAVGTSGAGPISSADASRALGAMVDEWNNFITRYTDMFARAQFIAASIPFGVLAVLHESYVRPVLPYIKEESNYLRAVSAQYARRRFQEDFDPDSIFRTQMDDIIAASNQRVWQDGLQLSRRIWNLDNYGRVGLNAAVANSTANGHSAWDLAQDVEQFLGAGQNCPRWSYERLRDLTKQDIADGDGTGLHSGDECRSQGVAYNALRLARTETQAIFNMATVDAYQRMPFVEAEQIHLSPDHATPDQCDDVASGGDNSDGVYKVGDIDLPLHPHCVTPGQLVQTNRGLVPIEDVLVGDSVLTHNGRYEKVVAHWSSPHRGDVYTIDTGTLGGSVELTGNHPVLTSRGWVNTSDLKLGDDVLHASVGAVPDLLARKAKHAPAFIHHELVPSGIVIGIMPIDSIALDVHLDRDDGKIEEVSAYGVFALVDDIGAIQGIHHTDLDASWSDDADFPTSFEHGNQPGIVLDLGRRDFLSNLRSFGGVVVACQVERFVDFLEHLAGRLAASAVISLPTSLNGLAHFSQRDPIHLQDSAQHAVRDFVSLCDFGCPQPLLDVDVLQEFLDGTAVLGLDSQDMKLGYGNSVRGGVGIVDPNKVLTTNGASNGHCSLLSLRPDSELGPRSGNLVVDEVANPIQALTYYSTIRSIKKRPYSGLVYNMEVENDNSYIVNGVAVHNCLCYRTAVLMDKLLFQNQMRGWLRNNSTWPAMNDYQTLLGGELDVDVRGSSIGIALVHWAVGDVADLGGLFWDIALGRR